jgi:dienelactone hydrolase
MPLQRAARDFTHDLHAYPCVDGEGQQIDRKADPQREAAILPDQCEGAHEDEGGQVFQRVCVSREFRVMAGGGTSPVVAWLRALATQALRDCGGAGIGAIGMCSTGNFAISMMIEPAMIAAVACQPSLPLDDPYSDRDVR